MLKIYYGITMDALQSTSKPKSFWKRPEGTTGLIFLIGILAAGGFLLATFLPALIALAQNVLYLSIMLLILAAAAYVIIDPRARNLVWYMYKSVMRWITGIFVELDPIGILKNYVKELNNKLREMNKQISKLRGQMHKLQEIIHNNKKEIESNLELASKAKENNKRSTMILKSRKAGRLRESNMRLEDLYKRMEVMYRVLTRMYENSLILKEDIHDQVTIKEQERKAIHASNSAMKSAMSIMSGDPDRRALFDAAMEAVADDVASKVGEMERFMDMSKNVMESIDLQNGIFEEEGLKMLEQWEKDSTLMLLDSGMESTSDTLDLNKDFARPEKQTRSNKKSGNEYDNLFG